MVDQKARRKYELRQRADAMDATRRRITDAAIELHGTVGPARTTVAAIAAKAGVQRHTVYRHFPCEDDLYAACSMRYWYDHPWPDSDAWSSIADPAERLATALGELYDFYASVEAMLANVLRDAGEVRAVARGLATYRAYLDAATEILTAGFPVAEPAQERVVRAAVRHATAFRTWQSLTEAAGLAPAEAVRLMVGLVRLAAGGE